jgi:transcriptional regulator with XRE-family HTH domain
LLGRRLRQLRSHADLTQEQAARRARVEPKYYGSVERGERNVSLDTLERLARAFGREPYELLVPVGKPAHVAPAIVSRRELEAMVRDLDDERLRLLQGVMECVAEYRPRGR